MIALDIGDRRIGIAVSDPFNRYAMPVDTLWRTRDRDADIRALLEIVRSRDAGIVVCGLPVNADGTESVQTEKTRSFIAALQAVCDLPVVTEDERFTSVQAHESLHEQGFKAKKHKKNVDAVAAAYILDGYLARKNQNKE